MLSLHTLLQKIVRSYVAHSTKGFLLQVAWMHFEQSAILTVHNHVITRNPRISVAHDKHRTWFLHINNVQEEDKGRYMCQINTVTAKTQYGYLHVVGKYLHYFQPNLAKKKRRSGKITTFDNACVINYQNQYIYGQIVDNLSDCESIHHDRYIFRRSDIFR